MANELAEFSRNFEYCFFRAMLKVKKSPRAYMVHAVDLTSKKVMGEIVTIKMSSNSLSYDFDAFINEAEPIVPHAGYLNTEMAGRPTALFLSVMPDRQYRKALHYEEGSVLPVPIKSPALDAYSDTHGKGKYDLYLKHYAHQLAVDPVPRFMPFRWAVDQVDAGVAHSVAISRFFCLSLHPTMKFPVLWHKNSVEGVVINHRIYGSDKLLPFKDFFRKKWDIPVHSYEEAPVR